MAGFEAPPIERHDVQILTPLFQYSGQLEAVGTVFSYINDPQRNSLSLYDAQLVPLTPGGLLKHISRPHVIIRKPQIAFLTFASAETRASIRVLVKKELLVAYTPVAVCRGYFHMPAEANVREFMDVTQGELLTVTEAQLFPLIRLPAPFPTQVELLLVGRSHLQFYHPA
jgi:hypothetical protein